MGFGKELPFDLPTAVSQVTNGDGTDPGGFTDDVELANAAYGQAETFVTPLQMALVAATIANDGDADAAPAGDRDDRQAAGRGRSARRRWAGCLSAANADAIKAAMVKAVEGTLGRQFTTGAKVPGITTAGKSGTAELGGTGEPHRGSSGSPRRTPQVAIAVLVEQAGRGGEVAAPIAGT